MRICKKSQIIIEITSTSSTFLSIYNLTLLIWAKILISLIEEVFVCEKRSHINLFQKQQIFSFHTINSLTKLIFHLLFESNF